MMPSFDAIDTSACDHLAFAIENQIDLFFALVMMREICTVRCDFHQEETRYGPSSRDAIALAVDVSHEQTIKRRRGMAFDGLRPHVLNVRFHRLWRQRSCRKAFCVETHYYNSQRRAGLIGNAVRNGGRKINIIFVYQQD